MSSDRASPTLGIEGLESQQLEPYGLWGRAFRPFFLGLAIYAAAAIPWWVLAWLGIVPAPAWLIPMWWHGHEMIFGFVAAAVAGFLLTAAPVWTGGPALTGVPLAVLFSVWVAGRIAFAAAGSLPTWLVAVVDLAFLPGVAIAALRTIWGSGQVRNYAVVGIVVALAIANAAMHAEASGLKTGIGSDAARVGLRFAVDLVVVLLLVIAGRITPAFTRNAFRNRGLSHEVRSAAWLDRITIGAAVAVAVSSAIVGRTPLTGLLALFAALAAGARFAGWQSWQTRGDPLLWSLHAASAWVVAGLLLVGLSDLGAPIAPTAGLHALTAGALGGAIMAVMTRVGLGHTGRPLELPAGVTGCYVLVHGAALARVAAPFTSGEMHRSLLLVSGLAWACAFGLFAIRYASILSTPRPDGRPG